MTLHAESPYAPPKHPTLQECDFYHRLDIPGVEGKTFDWDLRGQESAYLGGFDFTGKRVLEIGAASGGLTFPMEKMGADVVGLDLSPDISRTSWDVFTVPGQDREEVNTIMARGNKRLNHGWWLAHNHFNSRAKFIHATAYDIPAEIGLFDVVTFGSVLLHLRDPVRALDAGIKFSREYVIVTERLPPDLSPQLYNAPLSWFAPGGKRASPHGGASWQHFAPGFFLQYFDCRGFKAEPTAYGKYKHKSGPINLYTIIARRS